MDGVSSSRFPPLIRFSVSGVRSVRSEPTDRGWAGIRTCLIDNPRDDECDRRQEVWTYQNRNRGVVKSLLKKLPNIPFRVKKKKMKQRDIENERDRIRQTISKLPNISNTEHLIGNGTFGRNTSTRPLGMSKYSEFHFRTNDQGHHNVVDIDIERNYDDNNNENEIEQTSSRLPVLTDRPTRTSPAKMYNKLDDRSKKVSFSTNDLTKEIDRRSPSTVSGTSTVSDSAMENYGHTSYGISEVTPRSVLDVFGNNDDDETKTKKTQFVVSNNHQKWFKRVVGDKELIAANDYENFARISRPEGVSDNIPVNGKIPPEKQYSKSGWNVRSQPFYSNQTNKSVNSTGFDKHDNKMSKLSSTKVSSRSVESRFNDYNNVRQNDTDKFKRFDRAYQTQTLTQHRIAERVTQSKSPDRNGNLSERGRPLDRDRSPERNINAQSQTPSRLADRLAMNKSPERLMQGSIRNNLSMGNSPARLDQGNYRASPQRHSKLATVEQQFNDVGAYTSSPYLSPSPKFMGEYKLSKSPPPVSPGRYFPIFPTDGTPMRKIGGKNKMQKSNSRQDNIVLPLQETDTYLIS